jgi:hypothetical protein
MLCRQKMQHEDFVRSALLWMEYLRDHNPDDFAQVMKKLTNP